MTFILISDGMKKYVEISFFTKPYGKKVIGGQIVGGIIATGIIIFRNKVEDIIEEFVDYIKTRDPIKMFN